MNDIQELIHQVRNCGWSVPAISKGNLGCWQHGRPLVYQEQTDGKPPAVGTLYVQKWALGTDLPKELLVTITAPYA